MRVVVVLLSLWSSLALAQPGQEPQPPQPPPPPPPPAGEPAPSGDIPAGEASDSNPASAPAAEPEPDATAVSRAWGPLDYTGWPRGFSVEDLRGLPECGPEGLPPTPGAQITCRPPMAPATMSWSIGVDFTTGGTFGTVATTGGAHGFGVDTHVAPSRYLQLGLRYEFLGISVPRSPGVDMHAALSHHLLASLRLRLWTDETGRNAWTLGGGGGLAIRGDELGGVAPIVRASLAREVGLYYRHNASVAAFELAYERSFADSELQAILASLRT
ncbi:MAG TPA: hypothetical protein VIV40_02355, partial [Kofleriaceae bacterium]